MWRSSQTTENLSERPRNVLGSRVLYTWTTEQGGLVTVHTDARGIANRIELTVGDSEDDAIDLPCARGFDVRGSHVNLDLAVDPTVCAPGSETGVYTLRDGSVFKANFYDPGDGGLREAVWYAK